MYYCFAYYMEALQCSIQKLMRFSELARLVLVTLVCSTFIAVCTQSGMFSRFVLPNPYAIDDSSDIELSSSRFDPSNQPQQAPEIVSDWLARRYHLSSEVTQTLVTAAYSTAQEVRLDPLLILSVIAIESSFNPRAESSSGAQGLMQVMAKIHQEKFDDLGGMHKVLHPATNIKVGSSILKEYITRGGSLKAGLKMYVGAGSLSHDQGYGEKVIAEYIRLKEVAQGKEISIFAKADIQSPKPTLKNNTKRKVQPTTENIPNTAESENLLSASNSIRTL